MANTFTSLPFHVIFSTKNRQHSIRPDIEPQVWSYLGEIARDNDMKAVLVGGIENQLHLLLDLPPVLAVSQAVQSLKGGSSRWIKQNFPGLHDFGWQDGYAAFTVSKSHVPEVERYIRRQREHHRVKAFEEEYRAFLDRHEIRYDERYVFDAGLVG